MSRTSSPILENTTADRTSMSLRVTTNNESTTIHCGAFRPKSISPAVKKHISPSASILKLPVAPPPHSTSTIRTKKPDVAVLPPHRNIFHVQRATHSVAPALWKEHHILLGFRPDLAEEDQLGATDLHRAERQRSFLISAASQASFPPATAALSSRNPKRKLHLDYSYQEKELLWALKARVAEAHRYHNRRTAVVNVSGPPPVGGPSTPAPSSLMSHQSQSSTLVVPRASPQTPQNSKEEGSLGSPATKAFVNTLMQDVEIIFRMCKNQNEETIGVALAYHHSKEQMTGLNLWGFL